MTNEDRIFLRALAANYTNGRGDSPNFTGRCILDIADRSERVPPDWLNRRAYVEEEMLACAAGKKPMPDAAKLREWAARLGAPSEYHGVCRSIPSATQTAEERSRSESKAPTTDTSAG